jgi:hypothetical protein
MASVTFAGSTLWDNDATGIDQVLPSADEPVTDWQLVALPQGGGRVAKYLGLSPGAVTIQLQYRMSNSDMSSLRSTINNKIGSFGILSIPPGQTYSRCILRTFQMARGQYNSTGSGDGKFFVSVTLVFERL